MHPHLRTVEFSGSKFIPEQSQKSPFIFNSEVNSIVSMWIISRRFLSQIIKYGNVSISVFGTSYHLCRKYFSMKAYWTFSKIQRFIRRKMALRMLFIEIFKYSRKSVYKIEIQAILFVNILNIFHFWRHLFGNMLIHGLK